MSIRIIALFLFFLSYVANAVKLDVDVVGDDNPFCKPYKVKLTLNMESDSITSTFDIPYVGTSVSADWIDIKVHSFSELPPLKSIDAILFLAEDQRRQLAKHTVDVDGLQWEQISKIILTPIIKSKQIHIDLMKRMVAKKKKKKQEDQV